MSSPCHLLCFAKAPELGRAKTRLAASIGNRDALLVYQELLRRSAQACHDWDGPCSLVYTGNHNLFNQGFADLPATEQVDGDLGTRLFACADAALQHGSVVLIGTDCPQISAVAIAGVCAGLTDHDVSFGPADDGGYWCIAIKHIEAARISLAPSLPWSQPTLLNATEYALADAGMTSCRKQTLSDLDTLDDLQLAQSEGFPSLDALNAAE